MNPYAKSFVDAIGHDPIDITPQNIAVPQAAPQQPHMSRGQMILGILADVAAGAAGRQGPFAAALQQRKQQAMEDAQWTRRQNSALQQYEAQKVIDRQYDKPEVSPIARDVAAYQALGPDGQAVYRQMHPEADVVVPLPDGTMYAGPRSGLAAALAGRGGQRPAIGSTIPLNGGPTPQASGNFPR